VRPPPPPPRPTQALGCRWAELRQAELGTEAIQARIDGWAAELAQAQARNFAKWPVRELDALAPPAPRRACAQRSPPLGPALRYIW
jgi:hypothetical protein